MPRLNAEIIRLYDTVFDRAPDAGGLANWNVAGDAGMSLDTMADLFIIAPEFALTYGQPDNASFVRSVYENVLDRAGDPGGLSAWTYALDMGALDRGGVVVGFSESQEHINQMAANATRPPPVIFGSNLGDVIDGTELGERIVGVTFDQLTSGGPPNFTPGIVIPELTRGDGADILSGRGGNDTVEGAGGNDRLSGGPGNDYLVGGEGADWLNGGEGADVFRFAPSEVETGDYVEDFEVGADKIQLDGGVLFQGQSPFVPDGRAQFRFWLDTSPRATGNNKYLGDTVIEVDANGNGVAEASILVHHTLLGSGDFLV